MLNSCEIAMLSILQLCQESLSGPSCNDLLLNVLQEEACKVHHGEEADARALNATHLLL